MAIMLRDFKPWEVSLVRRAANGRERYLILKSMGGEIDMNDEQRKMLLESLGFDVAKFEALEPEQIAKAIADLEKAEGDPDGDGDGDGDEAGDGDSVAKKALDVLGAFLNRVKLAKSAGAGAGEGQQELPEDPRIAELQKRVDAQDKELAAERERARVAKAVSDLDSAVAEKRIIPATRDALRPIVEHLARTEAVHVSKAADGSDVESSMAALVVKALEHDAQVTGALFREVGGTSGDGSTTAWDQMPEPAGAKTSAGGNNDGQ